MELITRGAKSNVELAFLGRRFTKDHMLTFDGAPLRAAGHDGQANALGAKFTRPYTISAANSDGSPSVKTYDSTGAFMVGELERLDQTLHDPLVAVSWQRDIDLREDVTIADEVSSFTQSTFASPGGLGSGNSIGNGKAWVQKNTTQVPRVGTDIAKVTNPLRPWSIEIAFTIFELLSAAQLGRPVDQQDYQAMRLKHQMDIDEQVYIGDTSLGDTGLVNNAGVTPTNVNAGASGKTQWVNKQPSEILADVNQALTTTWANAGWAVMPQKIGIPPAQYGYISQQLISQAGNQSILKYILDNNLITAAGAGKLEIVPIKWLLGSGSGGTVGTAGTVDRMLVYTQDHNYVRFPMTTLQRTPLQYDGLWHKTDYYCRLGRVEVVYTQTIGYYDGI